MNNYFMYRIWILYFLIFLLTCFTVFLSCRIEETNLSENDVIFIDGVSYRITLVVNESENNYYHLKKIKNHLK